MEMDQMESAEMTRFSPSGGDDQEDSSKQYDCPICHDILKNPIRTRSCQHVFCKSCFVAAVRALGPACPMCRGPVREDEKRAADVQREMRQKRGSCPACGEQCFLSKMRAHYKYCRKYRDEFGSAAEPRILPRNTAQLPPTDRVRTGASAVQLLSVSSSPRATYSCPYCPLQGFHDMALVQHCLGTHASERSPVVCPICTATSWGDVNYCSRNFISHLRARHRFSYNAYMNVQEDEEVQLHLAIQQSSLHGIPIPPTA